MPHLCFDAPADAVMDARDAIAEETGCRIVDRIRSADVPGRSVTGFTVGDRMLAVDDAQLAALSPRLVAVARRAGGRGA